MFNHTVPAEKDEVVIVILHMAQLFAFLESHGHLPVQIFRRGRVIIVRNYNFPSETEGVQLTLH